MAKLTPEQPCPTCGEWVERNDTGVAIYECHACEMAWPVTFFGED